MAATSAVEKCARCGHTAPECMACGQVTPLLGASIGGRRYCHTFADKPTCYELELHAVRRPGGMLPEELAELQVLADSPAAQGTLPEKAYREILRLRSQVGSLRRDRRENYVSLMRLRGALTARGVTDEELLEIELPEEE